MVADFIDGMNLNEKWGQDNVDCGDLEVKGMEFIKAQNEDLSTKGLDHFNTNISYRTL